MRRRMHLAFCFLAACAGESGDERADDTATTPSTGTDTSGSGSESTSDDATTTTESTSESSTDTGSETESTEASSSEEGPDCDAPADCATCWTCARDGACSGPYEACAMNAYCIPSLTCVEFMCTADGLMQSCADTCCMSCTMLGTCQAVDAAISCIEQQCAQLCGDVSCP